MADDAREAGIQVLTGGTDVHLILVDLRDSELDGQQAEDRLHEVGITVNRNAVPNDPRPPMVTSGLRIGTPALATRGFGADEFTEVADIIAEALKPGDVDIDGLRKRAAVLAERFPLYPNVTPFTAVRPWLRPGMLGLHAFGAVAVAVCVLAGLWQLGVYGDRIDEAREVRQSRGPVELDACGHRTSRSPTAWTARPSGSPAASPRRSNSSG